MSVINPNDHTSSLGSDHSLTFLTWPGFPAPGTNGLDENVKRFQHFALDIQKAYADALSRQAVPYLAAMRELGHSLAGLNQSAKPQDIAAAQLRAYAAFFENASPWSDFVQKFDHRCASFAREMAQELRKSSGGEPPV